MYAVAKFLILDFADQFGSDQNTFLCGVFAAFNLSIIASGTLMPGTARFMYFAMPADFNGIMPASHGSQVWMPDP
jgi:hypothetical protein